VCIRIQELGRSAVSEERMLAVTYRPKVVASVNVREGLTATLTDFAEKIQERIQKSSDARMLGWLLEDFTERQMSATQNK